MGSIRARYGLYGYLDDAHRLLGRDRFLVVQTILFVWVGWGGGGQGRGNERKGEERRGKEGLVRLDARARRGIQRV